jgi:hypothetical protein
MYVMFGVWSDCTFANFAWMFRSSSLGSRALSCYWCVTLVFDMKLICWVGLGIYCSFSVVRDGVLPCGLG